MAEGSGLPSGSGEQKGKKSWEEVQDLSVQVGVETWRREEINEGVRLLMSLVKRSRIFLMM